MISRAYPNTGGLANVLPAYQPQLDSNGNGIPIDGYTPANYISYGYHRNAVLAIINNGQLLQMPLGIGLINPVVAGCVAGPGIGNPYATANLPNAEAYQIHNHDHGGVWHVEPKNPLDTFKLGSLFDIWGNQPITRTQVANQTGPVRIFTYNGTAGTTPVATEWTGNPYDAPFATQMNDVTIIEIGAFTPLPRYYVDPNYENFQCI
ncbi:MAG TPA: hypothetical protein VE591_15720 [Candidatus Acidoferrum sp.]|nr:hypothetical protein [Candidatus Acidoferrum sp.]